MTEESPEEDHGSPGVTETNPGSPCLNNNNNSSSNKEQDRFLPIANVGRIMKKVLPPNGKISKDAKETVQECVSEFISFVTGEASDKCQREKRKTINGDDIIWAITTLGFEDYVAPLKIYLLKYRETEGDKVNSPKQQQRQQQQQQQHLNPNNHHFHHQFPTEQDHSNMSCTSYISHPFLPAVDHQPFPNIAFSPKSLQKPFSQQHDNMDAFSPKSLQKPFSQQHDNIDAFSPKALQKPFTQQHDNIDAFSPKALQKPFSQQHDNIDAFSPKALQKPFSQQHDNIDAFSPKALQKQFPQQHDNMDAFSPKTLQKPFPQQHENIDSIHW